VRRREPAQVFKARVLSVDRTRFTVDVVGENNEHFTGIPIQTGYVGSSGQGSFWMPEANSIVYLCQPSDSHTPFLMGGCALPKEQAEDEDAQDDYRQSRPVLNEGDQMVASSSDGNFIVMRKGGVLEVGGSQTCQRLYIPLTELGNFIRDFCQNYELVTTGGSLSWTTRRGDEAHGGGTKTPAEFSLQIKEFTGEESVINLKLGRIKEEDGQKLVGGLSDQVIASLVIGGFGTRRQQQNFRLYVDKGGNVMRYIHGTCTTEHNGPVNERYNKSRTAQVIGQFRSRLGSRYTEVLQDDYLSARNRVTKLSGNLEETISGSVIRTTGQVTEKIKGSWTTEVEGLVQQSVTGSSEETVAEEKNSHVGKGRHEVVGGRYTLHVGNSQVDDVGYDVTVAVGEIHVHDVTGKIKISVGPSSGLAVASVTVKPTGTVILETAAKTKVEVNGTGVSVSTPAGEMTVDLVGTVALGLPAGRGAVVTTTTHPVDYVTGAPILGASSVVAGGIPSPVGLVSTFVSDPT
jgi:hypothetical protein